MGRVLIYMAWYGFKTYVLQYTPDYFITLPQSPLLFCNRLPRGEIDPDSYVEGFVGLLGRQISSRLFPEVAQLTLTHPYP